MDSIQVLLWIFVNFLCILTCNSFHCVNENKANVDWFVIYKLPKRESENTYIDKGVAYTYMTSDDFSNWKFSNYGIDAPESMLVKTLEPFYSDDKSNLMYILYNDQPPHESSNEEKGHNKGVVLLNNQGGFWLVHSIPHFPPFGTRFSYPETGRRFGQSILCISMNLTNLNTVGQLLQYYEPQIFGAKLKSAAEHDLPDLWKAANNITVKTAPYFIRRFISSSKGVEFTAFAKTKNFSKDLYTDLVAPALKSNLLVESWPNLRGRLPSNCSHQFKINNVKSVNMKVADCTFTTTEDHSKWAVSESDVICIGDMNRAKHEMVRGGGTVCQQNKILSENYKQIIETIENC